MNRAPTGSHRIALARRALPAGARAARWRRQAWPAEAIAREGLETLSGVSITMPGLETLSGFPSQTVRSGRLELPQALAHQNLNLARLPNSATTACIQFSKLGAPTEADARGVLVAHSTGADQALPPRPRRLRRERCRLRSWVMLQMARWGNRIAPMAALAALGSALATIAGSAPARAAPEPHRYGRLPGKPALPVALVRGRHQPAARRGRLLRRLAAAAGLQVQVRQRRSTTASARCSTSSTAGTPTSTSSSPWTGRRLATTTR